VRDPAFEIRVARLNERLEEAGEKPFTVVFFGSSQTAGMVHPKRLEPALAAQHGRRVVAYNLGTPAFRPFGSLLTLDRLLRRGVRPDLIVFEAAPFHLNEPHPPWDGNHFAPEILAYRDVGLVRRYGGEETSKLRLDWWTNFFVPAYAHRKEILSHAAPKLLPLAQRQDTWLYADEQGCIASSTLKSVTPEERERYVSKVCADMGPELGRFRLGGANWQAVLEVLQRGQAEKIPVVILVTPQAPSLRGLYPAGCCAETLRTMETMCRRHDARLVNTLDWCAEEEFIDAIHLLLDASLRYSDRLAGELAPLAVSRADG
jgi:hypothetical protein